MGRRSLKAQAIPNKYEGNEQSSVAKAQKSFEFAREWRIWKLPRNRSATPESPPRNTAKHCENLSSLPKLLRDKGQHPGVGWWWPLSISPKQSKVFKGVWLVSTIQTWGNSRRSGCVYQQNLLLQGRGKMMQNNSRSRFTIPRFNFRGVCWAGHDGDEC